MHLLHTCQSPQWGPDWAGVTHSTAQHDSTARHGTARLGGGVSEFSCVRYRVLAGGLTDATDAAAAAAVQPQLHLKPAGATCRSAWLCVGSCRHQCGCACAQTTKHCATSLCRHAGCKGCEGCSCRFCPVQEFAHGVCLAHYCCCVV